MKNYFKVLLKNSSYLSVTGLLMLPAQIVQAAPDGDNFSLEEIVVSARKREESLQEVPISVSAFSAADIEAKKYEK